MQAVIIAGGLGTRLGQLTANQPKSLIPILGKPFIEYQFDFLKKDARSLILSFAWDTRVNRSQNIVVTAINSGSI